ncbi:MAG: fatty acid desaturase, partial [Brevundimonas sp.]|nr:fatty acid desaturase [Brevundimonas sp.]
MSDADLILRGQAEALAPAADVPAADRPVMPLGPDGLDRYTRRDLRKEEIAIARQFHGGRMWPYAVAAFGCFAVWLSFFPLAIMGMLNLPLAFVLSCFFCVGGYVTSHEAMHSNIGRPGTKYRWLNEAVGAVSTIPIVFPFSMARLMHLEHHYHTNHPEKDP